MDRGCGPKASATRIGHRSVDHDLLFGMVSLMHYRSAFLVALTAIVSLIVFRMDGPSLWPGAVDTTDIISARLSAVLVFCLAAFLASRRQRKGDVGLAIYLLAFLAAGSLGSYQFLMRTWTCEVDGQHYIIGGQVSFASQCAAEISKVSGATDSLWNSDELTYRFLEIQVLISSAAFAAAGLAFLAGGWAFDAATANSKRYSSGG